MPSIKKRKIVIKIVVGYFLSLSLVLGIVFFSLNRLNTIEKTVDDLINRLSVTRALSLSIINKIRLVRFDAEHYERYYRQEYLDQFNKNIVDFKSGLQEIAEQVDNTEWQEMISYIQHETLEYEAQFETIAKLIMQQQSLLSTVFLKQELLIENQLSAIRINVGMIHEPDIFFAFGNSRNSFQLMRIYQEKYLNDADERYFVMFKNNYKYATEGFNDLSSVLNDVSNGRRISANVIKAKEELQVYYETFLKIRSMSIALRKASRRMHQHELEIIKTASDIASMVDDEYQVQNKIMQSLVLRIQVELVVAFFVAIALGLGLIIAVSRKITTPIFNEMQQRAVELDRLARLDGLTGLANRRLLDERLVLEWQRMLREKSNLSIIMADIDFFKAYNDYYGHLKGDDCIIAVASTIDACLNRSSDLAGRYGGEEFMVILPNTDTTGAMTVAEVIRKKISDSNIEHKKSDIASYLTLSLGVTSIIPSKESSPEKLVSFADKALYEAKRNGRNQTKYFPGHKVLG